MNPFTALKNLSQFHFTFFSLVLSNLHFTSLHFTLLFISTAHQLRLNERPTLFCDEKIPSIIPPSVSVFRVKIKKYLDNFGLVTLQHSHWSRNVKLSRTPETFIPIHLSQQPDNILLQDSSFLLFIHSFIHSFLNLFLVI